MSEKIRVMLSEDELDARIRELGAQISKDFQGREIFLVCILKGASFFACELAKRIRVPVTMDFMSTSSYGAGTVSSGNVVIKKGLDLDPSGQNVLIVEDIIDSGLTLSWLQANLQGRGAASVNIATALRNWFRDKGAANVHTCCLLDKPYRSEVPVEVDYTGFSIPDEFVVGYGLDYDQKYRNLPYIGVVELNG